MLPWRIQDRQPQAMINALIFLNCQFAKWQQPFKDMRIWLRVGSCGKKGAERWPQECQLSCLWLINMSVWWLHWPGDQRSLAQDTVSRVQARHPWVLFKASLEEVTTRPWPVPRDCQRTRVGMHSSSRQPFSMRDKSLIAGYASCHLAWVDVQSWKCSRPEWEAKIGRPVWGSLLWER